MKQRTLGSIALSLPVAALLGFLFSSPAAYLRAEGCSCDYGKQGPYSHGACIEEGCPDNQRQQCNEGAWGGCTTDCPKLAACS